MTMFPLTQISPGVPSGCGLPPSSNTRIDTSAQTSRPIVFRSVASAWYSMNAARLASVRP